MRTAPRSIDSFRLAAALTLVGGFLDAYTHICRDGVYANAQTGNLSRFSILLADGEILAALQCLPPIAAFIVGIFLAVQLHKKIGEIRWKKTALFLEFLLMLLVGVTPVGKLWNLLANILVAFICGVQVETFKTVRGSTFASTMCTGNLRSATENLSQFFMDRDRNLLQKSILYFGIDGIYIAGLISGAFLTKSLGIYACLLCLVPLVYTIAILYRALPNQK